MGKRQEIELLRIVSAFGVVWFHTSALGRDIAYSGLIVFLILSMYFSTNPLSRPKPVLERVKRLLLPWLFWFLVFGVLNLVQKKPFIRTDGGILAGVLAGTSIHLWYLPFIFLWVVVFDVIKRHISGPRLAFICAVLVMMVFAAAGVWRPWSMALGSPWRQYAHGLNGVLIGVMFGNCAAMPKWLVSGLVALLLAVAAVFTLPLEGIFTSYAIGIIATALVLLPRWPLQADWKINGLADCAFGIYLSHPFWFLVLMKFGLSSEWAVPLAVFALSAVSIWGFRKILPSLARYVA